MKARIANHRMLNYVINSLVIAEALIILLLYVFDPQNNDRKFPYYVLIILYVLIFMLSYLERKIYIRITGSVIFLIIILMYFLS
jgi:hypothetical protein